MAREWFDLSILIVVAVGAVWAALRLRADLLREVPPDEGEWDTQEHQPQHDEIP